MRRHDKQFDNFNASDTTGPESLRRVFMNRKRSFPRYHVPKRDKIKIYTGRIKLRARCCIMAKYNLFFMCLQSVTIRGMNGFLFRFWLNRNGMIAELFSSLTPFSFSVEDNWDNFRCKVQVIPRRGNCLASSPVRGFRILPNYEMNNLSKVG